MDKYKLISCNIIISIIPIEGNLSLFNSNANLVEKFMINKFDIFVFFTAYYALFPDASRTVLFKDKIDKTIEYLNLLALFPEIPAKDILDNIRNIMSDVIDKFKKVSKCTDNILYLMVS